MKWNDSDWANDMFAAAACNWTPAPARHSACVLFLPVLSDPGAAQRCSAILSDVELQRAERFLTEEHRAHFQQRRAFRRYCGALALAAPRPLSQIEFQETETGRPYLPDLPDVWFSFSSCRFGFLGAWSSTYAVGVDIEDPTRSLEAIELARRFFSQAEAKAVREADGLARQRTFFQLWSLKEAALKSIGEGLPYGLDAFAFELVPDLRIAHAPPEHGGPERFDAHIIEGTDRCAALVLRERLFQAQKSI
jgi:phosphopantetheine--protein transferase-like protein